jgi:hypothetical protein
MVHPCKVGNPGTTMHACGTASSAETLCGLTVEPNGIDVLVGYTSVCKHCFPKEADRAKGVSGESDEIVSR